jgi:hypothetical protein
MSPDNPHDVDFFPELAPEVPNTARVSQASAQPSNKGASTHKVTSWHRHLKPAYVLSAAIVLALVWAVWPLMFKDTPFGASSIPQNSTARKYFAEPSGQGYNLADKTARIAPTEDATAALAASAAKAAELQNQVSDLQAQLAAVQANPPTCVAAMLPAPSTNIAPACQPSATQARRHRNVKTRRVLSQYRVNTLYPGQAWIEHEQRSWVVEPGAMVNDLRVLRIDMATRTVVTTQGDIR